MEIIKTNIEDVLILKPKVHGDNRGYFLESFSEREFATLVKDIRFVQENESRSIRNVIRGLHYQKGRDSQSKLVRVVKGRVLDVVVDIRKGSPTFGKYVSVELSDANHLQLFVPKGFAHGFAVLSEDVVLQYKCDEYYAPQSEAAIAWNDPEIGIDWGVPADQAVLSEKDMHNPMLKDAQYLFDYSTDLYLKD